MDPNAVEMLVAHIRDERLVIDYFYVAATAILIFDYLITFNSELTLIWPTPLTYTKVLFLLTRYLPFIEIVVILFSQTATNLPISSCGIMFRASTWMILFSMNIAEVILVIRTWAIWRKNKWVGIGLAAMMTACFVGQCVTMAEFNNSITFISPLYPGYRGCNISKAGNSLVYNYAVMCIIEGTVLLLVSISAFNAYRKGDNNMLTNVIHRDGIMFYVYILGASLANILVIKCFAPDLLALLSPLEAVIYSVLTSRIIFNIRETAKRGSFETTELHTKYQEGSLQFGARGADSGNSMQLSTLSGV